MILGSRTFPWRSVEDLAETWDLPFIMWQPRKYWSPGRVLFPSPACRWVKPVRSGQLGLFDERGDK